MSEQVNYTPPAVWTWEPGNGGRFANINRPTSGATHEQALPVGKHPLQLYSLATPNGVKVTIMLEELLAAGHTGAEYDAYVIRIHQGEQFGSGFVELNPNSKIPAMADHSVSPPQRVFESGSILLYLAEKFGAFLPTSPSERTGMSVLAVLADGSAPYLGGGFGHFYRYAPAPMQYPIDRFTMEVKRQLDVLDKQLADKEFICASGYSIADMAIWPWYGQLVLNIVYEAAEFLQADSYTHVMRWAKAIEARPAVKRGRMVNKTSGPLEGQLHERHDASDFELRTADKL